MILSELSTLRLRNSLGYYEVDDDYASPMYNYLVWAYSPGSFFTAILANDFMRAMSTSHPANTVPALKRLATWIHNEMPLEAWGSYAKVEAWLTLGPNERRDILERRGLIYTPKEETFYAIKEST